MSAASARRVLTCVVAAQALACASTTAPSGWLPTPSEAQSEAFGGWMSVEYRAGSRAAYAEGELIAVGPDTVFLLPAEGLIAIPMGAIRRATLTAYDAQSGGLAAWTLLGTVSTLSHGVGLIVSAPVWILTGSIATASASRAPRRQYRSEAEAWQEFRKFARFPQGLPPGVQRTSLRLKMPPNRESPPLKAGGNRP